jgi:hypothetical protein
MIGKRKTDHKQYARRNVSRSIKKGASKERMYPREEYGRLPGYMKGPADIFKSTSKRSNFRMAR